MKRTIEDALNEAYARICRDDFVRVILTGSRRGKKPQFQRIDLRPVDIKGKVKIQSVSHDGKKDYTNNLDLDERAIHSLLDSGFANIIVDTTSESYQVQITKKDEAITGVSKTKLERVLTHDRTKERLLSESHPVFRALGMADSTGRIKPTARDKYIQIDQLLRILEPTLLAFKNQSEIQVVDLASGSAALTCAVHVYLSGEFTVNTLGIERNPELVKKAQLKAHEAGLEGVRFEVGEIALAGSAHRRESHHQSSIDLVLALHACDTATDDAIDYVISSRAKVSLIVPCCHQSRQVDATHVASLFPFFGRDGIVDERLLDLATDALRGQRLRDAGFHVEIVEFVGVEHTARNLLLRVTRPAFELTQP